MDVVRSSILLTSGYFRPPRKITLHFNTVSSNIHSLHFNIANPRGLTAVFELSYGRKSTHCAAMAVDHGTDLLFLDLVS